MDGEAFLYHARILQNLKSGRVESLMSAHKNLGIYDVLLLKCRPREHLSIDQQGPHI